MKKKSTSKIKFKQINDKSSFAKSFRLKVRIWAIIIFVITLMIYTPTLKNNFVNWDDNIYVYENTKIQSLSIESFCWMLTEFHAGNWHPLAWLSHAIDYAFWELNPFGHHLTGIVLHALNTLLLFFLVIRLLSKAKELQGVPSTLQLYQTQTLIVAVVTALLFGMHPLHVESVAWVCERKDVLCAFFFLLSILCYTLYASTASPRNRWWYVIVLFFFVMALMSKPMAVTIPVVLLLLDVYPLERIGRNPFKNVWVLVEKIPFFTLSIISGIITIIAQGGSGAIKTLPLSGRILNAIKSLVFYMQRMICPVDLVPLYPFPKAIYLLDVNYILSGIILLAITGICLWLFKQGKYLFFIAWSYYVVTLLPVLGIIQVGTQAAADRYAYLPSISLFLLCGIGVAWSWERTVFYLKKRIFGNLMLIGIFLIISLLGYLTVEQIKIWRNSETMWRSVINVFPNAHVAHNNLGTFYWEEGKINQAVLEFQNSITSKPSYAIAYYNLGTAYEKKGELDKAIPLLKKAIILNPHDAKANYKLGVTYYKKGMYNDAIEQFKESLKSEPDQAEVYVELGLAFYGKGMTDEAFSALKKALSIKSTSARAHNNLGIVYAAKSKIDEAISEFKKAILINPQYIKAYNNLGVAYGEKEMFAESISAFKKAIAVKPPFAAAHNNLAWIYATCPSTIFRNGDEAIVLATKVCELTSFRNADFLNTLAAAYAEEGNFKKAIEYQMKAIGLGQDEQKPDFLNRLELYQSGQPYRSQ